jgi:hypothetical protein
MYWLKVFLGWLSGDSRKDPRVKAEKMVDRYGRFVPPVLAARIVDLVEKAEEQAKRARDNGAIDITLLIDLENVTMRRVPEMLKSFDLAADGSSGFVLQDNIALLEKTIKSLEDFVERAYIEIDRANGIDLRVCHRFIETKTREGN